MRRRGVLALVALAALPLLPGCAGGLSGAVVGGEPPQAAMAGRWMLAAPGGPPCGLALTESGGSQGKVTPDGGCPGAFFRSRRWTLARNNLVIADEAGETLGELTSGEGQFQGKAANGTPITLTRSAVPTAQ